MVLTVSCVLSLGTGLFCSHRRAKPGFAQLDTSVGVSGPHAFSVRISAVRPHDQSCAPPTRPSHPDPRFVTTRDPPLLPAQDGRIMHLIWVGVKVFSVNQNQPAATNWHDGQFAHDVHAQIAPSCRSSK